jgi:hypothetical protein
LAQIERRSRRFTSKPGVRDRPKQQSAPGVSVTAKVRISAAARTGRGDCIGGGFVMPHTDMDQSTAPGGTTRSLPPTDEPPGLDGPPTELVDDWKLAEYLEPVDRLLRELSKIEPPQCPDGLCKRTLDRCRIDLIRE